MTSIDTSFLKDELGPVLARGIAETVCSSPDDPIEFLGLWLQHHLQSKEAEAQERASEDTIKAEREEWNRKHSAKEKAATEVIQNEWRQHQLLSAERSDRESELRTRLEAFGEELDEDGQYNPEDVGYDHVSDPEAKEEEKDKEVEMLKAQRLYQRWKLYFVELSKENIADVKLRQVVDDSTVKTIRCVFYLTGKLPMTKVNGEKLPAIPSRLATWGQVRANIKPHPFLTTLQSFDPASVPKRNVIRVRRILAGMQGLDERIKETGGQVIYLLFQWLCSAVEFRCARDDTFKMKKEGGKEMPGMDGWEDDPGEEAEGEEKDEDEEVQKRIEESLAAEQARDNGEEEAAEE